MLHVRPLDLLMLLILFVLIFFPLFALCRVSGSVRYKFLSCINALFMVLAQSALNIIKSKISISVDAIWF